MLRCVERDGVDETTDADVAADEMDEHEDTDPILLRRSSSMSARSFRLWWRDCSSLSVRNGFLLRVPALDDELARLRFLSDAAYALRSSSEDCGLAAPLELSPSPDRWPGVSFGEPARTTFFSSARGVTRAAIPSLLGATVGPLSVGRRFVGVESAAPDAASEAEAAALATEAAAAAAEAPLLVPTELPRRMGILLGVGMRLPFARVALSQTLDDTVEAEDPEEDENESRRALASSLPPSSATSACGGLFSVSLMGLPCPSPVSSSSSPSLGWYPRSGSSALRAWPRLPTSERLPPRAEADAPSPSSPWSDRKSAQPAPNERTARGDFSRAEVFWVDTR